MTILLYHRNCKLEEKRTGKPVIPIAMWKYKKNMDMLQSLPLPIPEYGIQKKDTESQDVSWATAPIVDITSFALSLSSLDKQAMSASINEECSQLMTVSDVLCILDDALNMSKVALTMKKVLKGSPVFDYRMVPLFLSVTSIFFGKKGIDHM